MSRIDELESLIRYHNKKYFIENNPEISDENFDKLTEELRKLKPDSPVLFELIGEIGSVKHTKPMLSLDKRYTYNDIKNWVIDIGDTEFLIEPKYDGMAARYQAGQLSTRGDGLYGEDISNKLPYLKVVGGKPPTNPNSSASGEIVIQLSYFEKVLSSTYKNPRNAVVGIIKSKEVKPAGIRALLDHGVHFVLHDNAKHILVSKDELLDETRWEEILEEIFQTDYPLDGVVIKATSEEIKRNAGTTLHHDKWQIAYKSPAERKWSKVVQIKNQVGRTGRITSVAVVEPVQLSGATVTNVTLHNVEFVKSSGINIGSKVELCRSGEVIPFITKVEPSRGPSFLLPTNCPVCESLLIKNGKYLECKNTDCPARKSLEIEYFFKTLDVEDLGGKTIERFINEFKISSVIDFYKLRKDDIAKLEGFGEKSAKKIINNINRTLDGHVSEPQLLQALGIEAIGPAASKWIINQYGFSNLPSLKEKDLENIKGIGSIKAKKFVNEIKSRWFIVNDLLKLGLKFEKNYSSGSLKGKSFAITGTFGNYKRQDLIDIIEKNGGEYKTSITKGLTYLVVGEDGGSKLEKAKKLGIKTIGIEFFEQYL